MPWDFGMARKGAGTVSGTALWVLCTTVPNPFLNHAGISWPYPADYFSESVSVGSSIAKSCLVRPSSSARPVVKIAVPFRFHVDDENSIVVRMFLFASPVTRFGITCDRTQSSQPAIVDRSKMTADWADPTIRNRHIIEPIFPLSHAHRFQIDLGYVTQDGKQSIR